VLFAAICGAAFLLFAAFGYVAFANRALTVQGLLGSVAEKGELRTDFTSVPDSIGRLIFGTANNFIAAPALGSDIRAWMAGFVPSLAPYAKTLAVQIGPWLATLVLIALIYLRSVWRIAAGASGLVALAFLFGATLWAIYYNLNDPEHWFALTVPTVLLFLIEFPARITRVLIVVWAVVTSSVNLTYIGVPVATFPLRAAEAEIRTRYGPADLLVSFAAYGGAAYLGFFQLPGLPRMTLDILYRQAGSRQSFFAAVDKSFTETWQRGGKVVVFDVLDPYNWNAPWFDISARGLTKQALNDFFETHYSVVPLGEIAGLKAWQIRPGQPSHRDVPAGGSK
jgi:hypothetical protein